MKKIIKLLALLSVIVLSSCGGGGGSSSPPPPFINALLFSFPAPSAPANFPNALVTVQNATTGAHITDAIVTMSSGTSSVTLTYNSLVTHLDYEGTLLINPGDPVTLVVRIGGNTYTATGNQVTSYPTISAPVSGDSWAASNMNTVTWYGGAPLANAAYLIGVLDAADPAGGSPYFEATPSYVNNLSIPANSLTVGNKAVIVGITRLASISNADPNSYFLLGGFNYVPINVYTWTPRTTPISFVGHTDVLNSVVRSNTKYVAVGLVGSSGVIDTSSDGITWTSQTQNANSPSSLHSVAWSGAQFVAVGDNGTVRTSADGITWATQNSGATLRGVTWSGSQFVAVGMGGVILTSPDGAAWASQSSPTTNDLYGVTCTGSKCVAVGLGTILTSSDGINWAPSTSGVPTNSLYGVAWSGNNFAIATENGAVLTSADGANWSPSSAGSNPLYGIVWTGSRFVTVGNGGVIYTSLDGATWAAQNSGTGHNLYGVTYSGTQILAVGDSTILTSP